MGFRRPTIAFRANPSAAGAGLGPPPNLFNGTHPFSLENKNPRGCKPIFFRPSLVSPSVIPSASRQLINSISLRHEPEAHSTLPRKSNVLHRISSRTPPNHTKTPPNMDEEVVRIGKNVNRGAGGPRETVVKGKSALNAALRSGQVIGTEKKFATGNTVCLLSSLPNLLSYGAGCPPAIVPPSPYLFPSPLGPAAADDKTANMICQCCSRQSPASKASA